MPVHGEGGDGLGGDGRGVEGRRSGAWGDVEPVAATLERVGRQAAEAAARIAAIKRGPVDGGAARVEFAERAEHDGPIAAAGAEAGKPELLLAGVAGENGLAEAREGGLGAELNEDRATEIAGEGLDAAGELHGLAHLAHPIAGGCDFGVGDASVQAGDERQGGRMIGDALRDGSELGEDGIEGAGVERLGDGKALGAEAGARERGEEAGDCGHGTGEGRGGGAVEGGDFDFRMRGEVGREEFGRSGGGEHGAVGGQAVGEAGFGGDEASGVFEREHAGETGGGVFADAVAENSSGAHAPGEPETAEGELDGEERGLRVERLAQQRVVVGEECGGQRGGQERREERGARVDGRAKIRVGLVEFARHAGVVGTLAGEEEGDGGDLGGGVGVRGRGDRKCFGGQRPQLRDEIGAGPDRERGAVRAGGAAGVGGVADIGEREFRVRGDVPGPGGGILRGGGGRVAGDGEEVKRAFAGSSGGGRRDGRGFEEDVDVGAAETEGADPGETAGGGPGGRAIHDTHGQAVPRDVGIGRGEVEVGGNLGVLEREHGFDEAGDTGGGLEMADVGFDGAEEQRGVGGAIRAVDAADSAHLDGVAENGAGAVGLDVGDIRGGGAGVGEGAAEQGFLGEAVGRGEAVAPAVVVDGGTAEDGEDGIAVGEGVAETFEDDEAGALAARVAVGGGIEGFATAVGGEGAEFAGGDGGVGCENQVGAAGEGGAALTGAQALHREVDGEEGRGAEGVDEQRRTLEAEVIGEARGGEGTGAAEGGVGVDARRVARLRGEPGVVVETDADEDAGFLADERTRGDGGVLQRFPREFEKEAVLRVDAGGFARGDAEKFGVESVHGVEEGATADIHAAGCFGVGVVERGDVPASAGDVTHGIGAGAEHLPKRRGLHGAAGETTAEADDGDGAVVGRRGGGGDGGCWRSGDRGRGEVRGELGDGGKIVDDRRSDGVAEVRLEFARERDGGERVESECLERGAGVDGGGGLVEGGGDAGGEPGLERAGGRRRKGALECDGSGRRGGLGLDGFGAVPEADGLEEIFEKLFPAGGALNFPAGGFWQRGRLHQHDGGGNDFVFADEGLANRANDRGRIEAAEGGALDFLDDHEAFARAVGDGERGGAVGAERGVGGVRRGLKVLRVVIAPADDDEVFDTAGDEEFAVAEKTEIAGAQVACAGGAGESGAKDFLRELGFIPVAGADAGPVDPDLTDGAIGARFAHGGIDDGHVQAGGGAAGADEGAGSGRGRGCGDTGGEFGRIETDDHG